MKFKWTFTRILILGTPLLWVLWDFVLYIRGGTIATESAQVSRWAIHFPGIAFLVGVLCGHWFFQLGPLGSDFDKNVQ